MPIRITIDQTVSWAAEKMLSSQRLTDARKEEIIPITKYNLLVNVFNASTVLLALSVASAALFALSAAATFAFLGLLTRQLSEKELSKYTLPVGREGNNYELLQHALDRLPQDQKTANIFGNLRLAQVEGWNSNEVEFDVFSLWKNTIPVPVEARDPAHVNPPAAQNPRRNVAVGPELLPQVEIPERDWRQG
jgi:hypothetical protein